MSRVFGRAWDLVENILTSGAQDVEDVEILRRLRVTNLTAILLSFFGIVWTISFFAYDHWSLSLTLLALGLTASGLIVWLRKNIA
ncbi:MAG: hypothetical protein JRJ19_04950, partial [Deltaproteobacteria bacterium]|nr:hypothetical protein [Deltaproteobacteria bacterium]